MMKVVCHITSHNTTTGNVTVSDERGNEIGAFLYCLVVIGIYVAALAFMFVR